MVCQFNRELFYRNPHSWKVTERPWNNSSPENWWWQSCNLQGETWLHGETKDIGGFTIFDPHNFPSQGIFRNGAAQGMNTPCRTRLWLQGWLKPVFLVLDRFLIPVYPAKTNNTPFCFVDTENWIMNGLSMTNPWFKYVEKCSGFRCWTTQYRDLVNKRENETTTSVILTAKNCQSNVLLQLCFFLLMNHSFADFFS